MHGLAGVSRRWGSETKIIVDTEQDVVSAGDVVTSLREAIALAEATAGADEIVFAESLLDPKGNVRINIDTDPKSRSLIGSTRTDVTGYTVNSGDGLTINGDIDGDGVADVELNGGFITDEDRFFVTPHFQIGAQGDLRLEALNLIGGGMDFSPTPPTAVRRRGQRRARRARMGRTPSGRS